jgi:hypothetical protein
MPRRKKQRPQANTIRLNLEERQKNQLAMIKSGLMQYVGSIISVLSGSDEKHEKLPPHMAVAQLSEVWLECCKGEDPNRYDIFVAKPLLKAASLVLNNYGHWLVEDAADDEDIQEFLKPKLVELEQAINVIDGITDSVDMVEEEEKDKKRKAKASKKKGENEKDAV